MKTLKVVVTQGDIDAGCNIKPLSENCPIARAVQRALSPLKQSLYVVSVDGADIVLIPRSYGSEIIYYTLPKVARKFVRDFDNKTTRKTVQPFEFKSKPMEAPHGA